MRQGPIRWLVLLRIIYCLLRKVRTLWCAPQTRPSQLGRRTGYSEQAIQRAGRITHDASYRMRCIAAAREAAKRCKLRGTRRFGRAEDSHSSPLRCNHNIVDVHTRLGKHPFTSLLVFCALHQSFVLAESSSVNVIRVPEANFFKNADVQCILRDLLFPPSWYLCVLLFT